MPSNIWHISHADQVLVTVITRCENRIHTLKRLIILAMNNNRLTHVASSQVYTTMQVLSSLVVLCYVATFLLIVAFGCIFLVICLHLNGSLRVCLSVCLGVSVCVCAGQTTWNLIPLIQWYNDHHRDSRPVCLMLEGRGERLWKAAKPVGHLCVL